MEKGIIERPYVFFIHFNKAASKKAGRVQWTVHFRDTCHIVDHLRVNCAVRSRTQKKQPYAVLTGHVKPSKFRIDRASMTAHVG